MIHPRWPPPSFDSQAWHLFGDGAGVVVLRRLEDALAAGDRIYAVIRVARSMTVNKKIGFVAPTARTEGGHLYRSGREAQKASAAETPRYWHPYWDPIEFAALTEASDILHRHIALGAVKANIATPTRRRVG